MRTSSRLTNLVNRARTLQMPHILGLCLIAALAYPASAVTPTRVHHARRTSVHATRKFTMMHWNPVFAGSHELLVQQNVELDKLQLPRIANDMELLSYELS